MDSTRMDVEVARGRFVADVVIQVGATRKNNAVFAKKYRRVGAFLSELNA